MVHQAPPRGWLRFLLRAPLLLYRLKLGWLLGRRFLRLTHQGRKSGKARSTVLEVLRYDRLSGCCVIASGWGRRSQWYQNVKAESHVRYTVGAKERAGRATELPLESAERELRSYGERYPRAIRKLMRLMIGEPFEGGAGQYRRLASQVPVLELKPTSDDGPS